MIQSCGKCAGMTPVASNSCADKFGNCKELAKTMCYNSKVRSACSLVRPSFVVAPQPSSRSCGTPKV